MKPTKWIKKDRADAEYIQMAKNDTFRPLREVLADIDSQICQHFLPRKKPLSVSKVTKQSLK